MVASENMSLADAVKHWRLVHGYSLSEGAKVSGIPFVRLYDVLNMAQSLEKRL